MSGPTCHHFWRAVGDPHYHGRSWLWRLRETWQWRRYRRRAFKGLRKKEVLLGRHVRVVLGVDPERCVKEIEIRTPKEHAGGQWDARSYLLAKQSLSATECRSFFDVIQRNINWAANSLVTTVFDYLLREGILVMPVSQEGPFFLGSTIRA